MKTCSKAANQCHFVPFSRTDPRWAKPLSETPEPITHDRADGDCSYPFGDRLLNRSRA
jgi:hypothetical protein